MTEHWHDRIVEVRRMRIGDILPHPHNPRVHPASQLDPLGEHLRETGKTRVPTVYRSERAGGALVFTDGHARQSLDPDEVWTVAITDLTDIEADRDVAVGDPIGALATYDAGVFDALLRQVETDGPALQALLDELAFDVTPVEVEGDGANSRAGLARAATSVKAVFSVAQLQTVEAAITATGEQNRGVALATICEAYLARAER